MTENLYTDEYFVNRSGNDKLRQSAMAQEVKWIKKNTTGELSLICDVGCAAGEFKMHWPGTEYYGMEVNPRAIFYAKKSGINFDKNILNSKNYFDIILYRGTIQHINSPFEYLSASYSALKPGGYIAFLATPNIGSIVYRIAQHLPMLDPSLNLYLPSIKSISDLCKVYGFKVCAIETPYWNSPYRNLMRDHLDFAKVLLGGNPKNAFWGNIFNLIARKNL